MKRFVIAFFVLQVLKFLVGLFLKWGWLGEPGIGPWERLPITVLLPTLVALLVAVWMNKARPRRLFDPRVNQPLTQYMFGGLAGLVSAVVSALTTIQISDLVVDLLALVIAAGVTALAVMLSMPRKRPGRCVQCGAAYPPGESRCLNCFAEESQASGKGQEKLVG